MNKEIKDIRAEEILDSRGNPTLRVLLRAGSEEGEFAVPSGASTGEHEAYELRDHDPNHFNGLGVRKAVANVNKIVRPALVGKDVSNQKEIDSILIELDGTPNKSNLGGNAIIGVSVAAAKTAAATAGKEVYEYLRSLEEIKPSREMPLLYINMINGGKHADSKLDFQEYHCVPFAGSIEKALEIGLAVQRELEKVCKKELGLQSIGVGNEGGFVINTADVKKPLEFIMIAAKNVGADKSVKLSMDVAASSFYKDGAYSVEGKRIDAAGLNEIYQAMFKEFPIFSIEDPFEENDFNNFADLLKGSDGLLVVGDDLTVTSKKRLTMAIDKKSVNAVIIKPNQIGTLTETLETMKLARDNNIECIISHRSGETRDNFIADLAYAFGCFGIKAGGLRRGERLVKYNRLLHIGRSKINDQ